jgi:hypothetical protein
VSSHPHPHPLHSHPLHSRPPHGLYCAGQLADKVQRYWALIDNGSMPINASQPSVILLKQPVLLMVPPELSSVEIGLLDGARPWPKAGSTAGALPNTSPRLGMGSSGFGSSSASGLGGFSSSGAAPPPLPSIFARSTSGLAAAPNSVWVMVLEAALALHVAVVFG